MVEVRCANAILFGVLNDGIFEVKCRSRRCGHKIGTVVIHRFRIDTGELLETRQFKDPGIPIRREES